MVHILKRRCHSTFTDKFTICGTFQNAFPAIVVAPLSAEPLSKFSKVSAHIYVLCNALCLLLCIYYRSQYRPSIFPIHSQHRAEPWFQVRNFLAPKMSDLIARRAPNRETLAVGAASPLCDHGLGKV